MKCLCYTAQKLMFPADLATFTEEVLNGKLHFLCSVKPLADLFNYFFSVGFCLTKGQLKFFIKTKLFRDFSCSAADLSWDK